MKQSRIHITQTLYHNNPSSPCHCARSEAIQTDRRLPRPNPKPLIPVIARLRGPLVIGRFRAHLVTYP